MTTMHQRYCTAVAYKKLGHQYQTALISINLPSYYSSPSQFSSNPLLLLYSQTHRIPLSRSPWLCALNLRTPTSPYLPLHAPPPPTTTTPSPPKLRYSADGTSDRVGVFATLTNSYALVAVGASENFYRYLSHLSERLERSANR